MNKLILSVALITASFSALADGRSYVAPEPATSTVTRAQVQAETALAAARGEIVSGELSYVAPAQGSGATRAEVRMARDDAQRHMQIVSGDLARLGADGELRCVTSC
jgi:hypothetical protein